MAKTASAFFGGAAIGSDPVVPRFNHDGKSARGYKFTPVSRGEIGRIVTGESQPLAFGTEVIADLGNLRWGSGSYRPYDMSGLVPYGQPIPSVAEGKTGEYTDLLALYVYVRGHGLAQWLIGGVLAQNAVHLLWMQFCRAAEAVQKLIPVLTLLPSQAIPIASRNGEISWQPLLEISGWVQRDPGVFGPRTVRPPIPRLSSDGAAAAVSGAAAAPATLPQPVPVPVVLPPEETTAPVQAAAATSAPHYQPPVVTAPAVPPSPAPAAVDPFARMVRVANPVAVAPPVAQPAASAAVTTALPPEPPAVQTTEPVAATPATPVAAGKAASAAPVTMVTVAAPGAAPGF
jgi:hypothetical protein